MELDDPSGSRATVARSDGSKCVRMRLPIQRFVGIWNSEFLEKFSSNRYSIYLSTVSFVSYLNPMDGWLSAVQSLHKTLYVLKHHTNLAKNRSIHRSIHSNKALLSLDSHHFVFSSPWTRRRRKWTLIYIVVNTRMWIVPLWAQPWRLMTVATLYGVLQEKRFSE